MSMPDGAGMERSTLEHFPVVKRNLPLTQPTGPRIRMGSGPLPPSGIVEATTMRRLPFALPTTPAANDLT